MLVGRLFPVVSVRPRVVLPRPQPAAKDLVPYQLKQAGKTGTEKWGIRKKKKKRHRKKAMSVLPMIRLHCPSLSSAKVPHHFQPPVLNPPTSQARLAARVAASQGSLTAQENEKANLE